MIIVNDGSNDASLEIAKKYISPQITVLTTRNLGASAARNYGLNHAKGELIQFLDADDFISADKFANQVTLSIVNPKKLIVCSTVHFHTNDNLFLLRPDSYEERFIYDTDNPITFLTNLWGSKNGNMCMIQPNAWLTPINVIKNAGRWNENLSLDDDGEFFCRVILNSSGIVRDFKSLNFYRKFKNRVSLSGSLTKTALLSQFNANVSKKNELLNRLANEHTERAIGNLFLNLCIISYLKDQEIYDLSRSEILNLSIKPNAKVILGGKMSQLFTAIFGWKLAKILTNYIHQINE